MKSSAFLSSAAFVLSLALAPGFDENPSPPSEAPPSAVGRAFAKGKVEAWANAIEDLKLSGQSLRMRAAAECSRLNLDEVEEVLEKYGSYTGCDGFYAPPLTSRDLMSELVRDALVRLAELNPGGAFKRLQEDDCLSRNDDNRMALFSGLAAIDPKAVLTYMADPDAMGAPGLAALLLEECGDSISPKIVQELLRPSIPEKEVVIHTLGMMSTLDHDRTLLTLAHLLENEKWRRIQPGEPETLASFFRSSGELKAWAEKNHQPGSSGVLVAATAALAKEWPQDALPFLKSSIPLVPEDKRWSFVYEAVREIEKHCPRATEGWIETLPAGPEQDGALNGLVESILARTKEVTDPTVELEDPGKWIEKIPDGGGEGDAASYAVILAGIGREKEAEAWVEKLSDLQLRSRTRQRIELRARLKAAKSDAIELRKKLDALQDYDE